MESHPSAPELARFVGKVLDAETHARIAAHLDGCVLCRAELRTLEEMKLGVTDPALPHEPTRATPHEVRAPASGLEDTFVRPTPAPRPSGETLATGFEVGRYVVTRRLGQGAMGEVFAAWDPRLERSVAIKLLRADLPMVENKPLRARLVREAQALARLTHPNVIAVHDLGDFGEALFIAMDLVEGVTLGEWLREPRTWQEVVEVFRMAGNGLAAAHRAGLVHRDFKPDNVLVGADGVARVSDFGVSRRVDGSGSGSGSGEDTITGAGSLIGTPVYMSPEQFQGKPADARSDQFSFCVALFEALANGQRPFQASTLRGLADAVMRGPPERIPSRVTLPPWLEALVLKGLATRPEDRFESMDALLTALAGPAPARRSPVIPLAVSVAVLAVLGLLGWREYARRRDDPCRHIDERVAAVWNDAALARVRASARATGLPWAEDAVPRIDAIFRRALSRWSEEYEALCVELEQPTNLASVSTRQACLEGRLSSFVRVRSAYEKPMPDLLRNGLGALSPLLDSSVCGPDAWLYEVPADERRRAEFERLARRLDDLADQQRLSGGSELLAPIVALREESTALGFGQLAAAARLLEGVSLEAHGAVREALAAYEDAAVLAEASRNDATVAEARRRLVDIFVIELDVKQGRGRLPSLKAAYRRLGRDPDDSPRVLQSESALLRREGQAAAALSTAQKALSLLGPGDETFRCELLEQVAMLHLELGDGDLAVQQSKGAVDCARAAFGPRHPRVAMSLNIEATIFSRLARDAEAEDITRAALDIFKGDPDGRDYRVLLFNFGLTLKRQKKLEEALPVLEEAVRLSQKGDDQGRLALMLNGLAETQQELHQLDDALQNNARAIELLQKTMGPGARLSSAYSVRGGILEEQGKHAEAAAALREALDGLGSSTATAVLREVTRYDLGRSLWHDKKTRAEAIAMVKAVREYFAGRGPDFKDYTAEADEWLAKHK
ncbi:MAG: serine/threonine-protein kinase [Myxococcaceae bacterium]